MGNCVNIEVTLSRFVLNLCYSCDGFPISDTYVEPTKNPKFFKFLYMTERKKKMLSLSYRKKTYIRIQNNINPNTQQKELTCL